MDISIIICTRNRWEYLRDTLAALSSLVFPPGESAELIVVDNGSSDGTAAKAAAFPMPMPLRVVSEARTGKSHAYNSGIAAATGDILLFTDDDVRPPAGWIEAMCRPLRDGSADAVAGAVVLAPHLQRPWMEPVHRYWLAETEPLVAGKKYAMVGANMAISRKVLEKVPSFDLSLGPGALGFGEETLFSRQIWEAGFTIVSLASPAVEHHFQPERLSRASLLDAAQKRGETKAYAAHHWEHRRIFLPAARMAHKWLEVWLWHRQHPEASAETEGLPVGLIYNLEAYHFYRHFCAERHKPRLYEKHGLIKKAP